MVQRFDIPLASRLGANSELIYYYSGDHDCTPGHRWGPGLRDHFVIHFILSGKGSFTLGDSTHELEEGQGFAIFPETLVDYRADSVAPWHYVWVGFSGLKAEEFLRRAGLDARHPVFRCPEGMLSKERRDHFREANSPKANDDLKWTGILYDLIWQMIEAAPSSLAALPEQSPADEYTRRAIEFIHKNYSRKISVADIARYAGVDRKHLHAVFKKRMHTSPQQFLIRCRMEIACDMLLVPELQIGDIARSVGYEDPFLFSKMFRKAMGEAPAKWRGRRLAEGRSGEE